MSISNKENFQIFLLQNYHRKAFAGRLGLVQLMIDQTIQLYEHKDQKPPNQNFGLTHNEKLSLLQFASVGYLMMLVEDIALLCTSFSKNDPEYYQYLDRKGEEDLGKIIGDFFSKSDNLTNDDLRKILSIIHPDSYEFHSSEERNAMVSSLLKNIDLMRYFVQKTRVFYETHIGIFRRFKHAGFPVVFGHKIPTSDELFDKFETTAFAFTSRKNIEEILTTLPFSKQAMKSYLIFMLDIYQIMYTIINSRLIIMERKIDGVLPRHDDYFSNVLSTSEKNHLKKLDEEFNKKFQAMPEQFHVRLETQGLTGPWYKYLDSYYSKSVLELFKSKN